MRHTSTASNNRREIDYVSFQYAGSNSVLTTTQTFITAGTNVVTTPLRTCTNNKFFNTNFNVGIFIHGWNSGGFAFDNSVFFGDSGSSGAMYYTASGTFCELKNSVFYYSAGPCLLSAFSQGGQGCLYTDIKFASSASNLILWTNGDGGLFTRCTFHSVPSSFGVSISAGSGNFVNCNFFYSGAITNSTPVAWGTITTPSNLFSVGSAGSKGTWVASDSYFGTASTSLMNLPFLVTLNPQWSLTLINKNALVTSQEIYTPK